MQILLPEEVPLFLQKMLASGGGGGGGGEGRGRKNFPDTNQLN